MKLVTCQAQNAALVTRKSRDPVETVAQPLDLVHRRLAPARRHIAAFAASAPLMSSSCELGTNLGFVRPDCPPDLGEPVQKPVGAKAKAKPSYGKYESSKQQFKSALEQVSFLTNDKLRAVEDSQRARSGRLGFFGL